MWNAECGMEVWPAERGASVNSAFRIPHSALAVKHRRLVRGCVGRRKPEVSVCPRRRAAAARGAGEEALLHQERLVHLLERPRVLAHGGGDRGESYGTAVELLDDRLEDPPVHVVEPELVDVEPLQRLGGGGGRDIPAGAHLRVVAHALEQPVGDARRAAALPREAGDAHAHGACRAVRDQHSIGRAAARAAPLRRRHRHPWVSSCKARRTRVSASPVPPPPPPPARSAWRSARSASLVVYPSRSSARSAASAVPPVPPVPPPATAGPAGSSSSPSLSASSSASRSAVFLPMPLTDASSAMLRSCTARTPRSTPSADMSAIAIFGPTPDTPINRWKNRRAASSWNP